MEKWVRERVDVYLRHGGKTSRRATVKRLLSILDDLSRNEHGVELPPQVGRAHLHRYWARHNDLAATTLRDHWYAMGLLWQLLGRSGEPPRPPLAAAEVDLDAAEPDTVGGIGCGIDG